MFGASEANPGDTNEVIPDEGKMGDVEEQSPRDNMEDTSDDSVDSMDVSEAVKTPPIAPLGPLVPLASSLAPLSFSLSAASSASKGNRLLSSGSVRKRGREESIVPDKDEWAFCRDDTTKLTEYVVMQDVLAWCCFRHLRSSRPSQEETLSGVVRNIILDALVSQNFLNIVSCNNQLHSTSMHQFLHDTLSAQWVITCHLLFPERMVEEPPAKVTSELVLALTSLRSDIDALGIVRSMQTHDTLYTSLTRVKGQFYSDVLFDTPTSLVHQLVARLSQDKGKDAQICTSLLATWKENPNKGNVFDVPVVAKQKTDVQLAFIKEPESTFYKSVFSAYFTPESKQDKKQKRTPGVVVFTAAVAATWAASSKESMEE